MTRGWRRAPLHVPGFSEIGTRWNVRNGATITLPDHYEELRNIPGICQISSI
ncbi:predicted protein [Botrytis cinerea T4]|uniref:Uncharacterized protein n=1 Tax=Botryotinia fuckeliana (strain T4) TaxID=999810 RepID=G2XYM5_BOTF4|nr:predicted protein [Botrytis cinerea T4]